MNTGSPTKRPFGGPSNLGFWSLAGEVDDGRGLKDCGESVDNFWTDNVELASWEGILLYGDQPYVLLVILDAIKWC